MNVYVLKNSVNDSAEYIAEMVSLWAGNIAATIDLSELPQRKCTIIVPSGVEIDSEVTGKHLEAGSHIILVAPNADTMKSFGVNSSFDYADDGSLSHLRLVQPLLHTFSHQAIPLLGQRIGLDGCSESELSSETQIWAYMYENSPKFSNRPAIWTMSIGKGKLTVFTYDLVECYRNLRQGLPQNADKWKLMEHNYKASYLFGEDWSEKFESNNLPLADFHPMLLLNVIEKFQQIPQPRLWQLPGFNQSAILISGDEDVSPPEEHEEICSFLNTLGANMTIYMMPWRTQCEKEHLKPWMDDGHSFSVHPYPTLDWSHPNDSFAEYKEHLIETVKKFKRKFDLPVRCLRNHKLYWSGYTDLPELWQKLGIEMDCNYGYGAVPSSCSSFFSVPAASLPVSFLDSEFHRIDVLQQPCHLGDDAAFFLGSEYSLKLSPELIEAYAESLLEDTLKPLGTVFAVCFHPGNFARFAKEAEKKFLKKAKAKGAALISDVQWLDFWKIRSKWKLVDTKQSYQQIEFTYQGKSKSCDLSLSLPDSYDGRDILEIKVGGKDAAILKIKHFGQERVLVALPDGVNKTTVTIKLS